MSNRQQDRQNALTKARETFDSAKAAGRQLTLGERSTIDGLLNRADELEAEIKQAGVDEERMSRMVTLAPTGEPGARGRLQFDTHAMAAVLAKGAIVDKHDSSGRQVKALLTDGAGVAGVTVISPPVALGRPAQSLLDVIPAVTVNRDYSYLRQLLRTNNAAPVAPFGLKPTSVYGLTQVTDRLRVVAHLSEPADRFWLEDTAQLEQFIAAELGYGLRLALEAQVLSGPGTGETFTGLTATSGIQVQAKLASKVLTARAALTAVETVSDSVNGFYVLSPADWQSIETASFTNGQYVMADAGQQTPIESSARRLWGQPVYVTTGLPVGTGWYVQNDAVALTTDGSGVRMEWAAAGDDFSRNQLRARCEGRFGLAVYRPLGVVKLDLTA